MTTDKKDITIERVEERLRMALATTLITLLTSGFDGVTAKHVGMILQEAPYGEDADPQSPEAQARLGAAIDKAAKSMHAEILAHIELGLTADQSLESVTKGKVAN